MKNSKNLKKRKKTLKAEVALVLRRISTPQFLTHIFTKQEM